MAERAILVHCYGYDRLPDGSIQSNARGQLQVQAVLELEKQDFLDTIFLAGGHVWGKSAPALAEVMESDLRKRGSQALIIINPQAFTTAGEIDLYLQEVLKRRWTEYSSLANSTHLPRIMHIYASRGVEANYTSAEEIISQNREFQDFINQIKNSPVEKKFRWREEQALFAHVHGLEMLLNWFARKTRVKEFHPDF